MKSLQFVVFVTLLFFFTETKADTKCENKLFSFCVKSTPDNKVTILDVLEHLSSECEITLIFEDEKVNDTINKGLNYINATDFSLKEILDLLLSENNLFYTLSKNGKILKISSSKTKTFFIDYVSFTERKSKTNKTISTGSSNVQGGGTTTLDFTSEFKFWQKLEDEINQIIGDNTDSNQSRTLVNQDAGLVTVTGTKKELDRVEKYILDVTNRLHKQILIEAKILELKYDDTHSTGIDWGKIDDTTELLTLGISSDAQKTRTDTTQINTIKMPNYSLSYNFNIKGVINFLKEYGDVNLVSNPKILTLNNQPAVINVGEEINFRYSEGTTTTTTNGTTTTTPDYKTDSTFVGVTLDITPEVTQNDFIILKINPVISEVSKYNLDENNMPYLAPDIKIKQLSSIVKVKNGHKIIIGGLIQTRDEDKNTKVPLLGDLPILGYAFKNKTKTVTKSELIIILTPHIVTGKTPPTLEEYLLKFKNS